MVGENNKYIIIIIIIIIIINNSVIKVKNIFFGGAWIQMSAPNPSKWRRWSGALIKKSFFKIIKKNRKIFSLSIKI